MQLCPDSRSPASDRADACQCLPARVPTSRAGGRAQLGLDYAIPHLTAKSTVSLTSQPKVDLAVTTGHGDIVCGGETSFDTAKNTVTRWSVGAGAPQRRLHPLL